MSGFDDQYIVENMSVSELTYTKMLQHCREVIDANRRRLHDIQAETIEVDSGVFGKPLSSIRFPRVFVHQSGHSLVLSCSCDTPKTKLCEHQAQVLYSIMVRTEFRVFFDKELRNKKIRIVAADYGMENEADPEKYFQIEYVNNSLSIKPKIKELIKINTKELEQHLLPEKPVKIISDTVKKMILVIGKHTFYEYLKIGLYEGEITQSGKIKNPINTIDPVSLIWKSGVIEDVKFLTAVSRFQRNFLMEESASEFEILRIIVENPLKLDVFYHDHTISEKVTANSIVPVELEILDANIRLSVFKKEPFFEITGELLFQDTSCLFQHLNVRFNYFILLLLAPDCWEVRNISGISILH